MDMDINWFNDLFDGDYENVMNNVTQYVSHGCSGRNNVRLIGYSNGDANEKCHEQCRSICFTWLQ